MNEIEIRQIVAKVLENYKSADTVCPCESVPVEVSARHVHLTKDAVETLFGKGTVLTKKRELSQPGQFLSEQRVKLVTAKGEFANVAVLGPERGAVQVELSMTDCRTLGLDAPVNLSGDLKDACSLFIVSESGAFSAENSVIVAQNHIHMTHADAEKFNVSDSQSVCVHVDTVRPVTFENVIVRVSNEFSLAMHIDFDEANACCLGKNAVGRIVRR